MSKSNRIIVETGPGFNNYKALDKKLKRLTFKLANFIVLYRPHEGDMELIGLWCFTNMVTCEIWHPLTARVSSEEKRDEKMVESASALIVFWNGKSKSKEIKALVTLAKARGLDVRVVRY